MTDPKAVMAAIEAPKPVVATLLVTPGEGGPCYDVWLSNGMWTITEPGEYPLYASPVAAAPQPTLLDAAERYADDYEGEAIPANETRAAIQNAFFAGARFAAAPQGEQQACHRAPNCPCFDKQGVQIGPCWFSAAPARSAQAADPAARSASTQASAAPINREARHTTQCKRYDNNCGAVHPSNCPDCPFRAAALDTAAEERNA